MTEQTQDNLPTKPADSNIPAIIEKMTPEFDKVICNTEAAKRFTRMCLSCLRRNDALLQAFMTKDGQASTMVAFMRLAELGLEPDGRNAHLIPYKNEITLIIDFKGLVALLMRSGKVSKIHADKVCENDIFEVNLGEVVKHSINYKEDRGKPYCYYCLIQLKDGSKKCEIMTNDECEQIRKRSKAGNNGPWISDRDEMCKKTVFRRATKWLDISPELTKAADFDDDRFIEVQPTASKSERVGGIEELRNRI